MDEIETTVESPATPFPLYQRDWTVGSSMFHVRSNIWTEFVAACRSIESQIEQLQPAPRTTTPVESTTGEMVLACQECGAPVTAEKKITWKGSDYWVRDCTSNSRHKTGVRWRRAG